MKNHPEQVHIHAVKPMPPEIQIEQEPRPTIKGILITQLILSVWMGIARIIYDYVPEGWYHSKPPIHELPVKAFFCLWASFMLMMCGLFGVLLLVLAYQRLTKIIPSKSISLPIGYNELNGNQNALP